MKGKPVIPPVYLTATYQFEKSDDLIEVVQNHSGYLYSRWDNPSVKEVEQMLAELEGYDRALGFGSGLDQLRQLDLQPSRKMQAEVALEYKRDAAFAGLAVDPDHRLVVTADVTRIDREVGNLPRFVRLLQAQAFADGILMAARKRGIDEFSNPRMAGMDRQAGAVRVDIDNAVGIRQVEARIDALAIQIHRQGDDIHVPGTFTIAEQCAFNTVGACHQAEFGRCDGAPAVVVSVQRDDDGVPACDIAAEVLNLIGE